MSLQVMTSYDGKIRGFGFVSFEEPEAAQRVNYEGILSFMNLFLDITYTKHLFSYQNCNNFCIKMYRFIGLCNWNVIPCLSLVRIWYNAYKIYQKFNTIILIP